MRFLESQKAPVSEHASELKVFLGPKHCSNLHGFVFILILFNPRQIELENISLNQVQRIFANTLTVDHIYSPDSWEKFPQPVQTHLL